MAKSKKNGVGSAKKAVFIGKDNFYSVALAGNSPLLKSVLSLLRGVDFREAFPNVKVVAWFDESASGNGKPVPSLRKVPVYVSMPELFAAHPNLDIVVDTSRNSAYLPELRKYAPPHVSVMSRDSAYFFVKSAHSGSIAIAGGMRLRRARHSFLSLIDQIEEEVLVMDNKGKLLQANSFFWEHSRENQASFNAHCYSCRQVMEVCCGVGGEQAGRWLEEGLKGNKFTEVYTEITPEGFMLYFRVIIVPLTGERGEQRLMLMRRDITERVKIEQRLQQNEKMAAIGDLSTYIAHEIRNPLFSIGGFANSLLRSTSLDDSAKEKARIILEESQRLDGILKSITNFARPTDNIIEEVDAGQTIRQTAALMSIADGSRHIITEIDIAPNLPKAMGNVDQLRQCLINLIKNAQEAMPEGGKLTLRAFMSENMVCLSVADTGVGISTEAQKQLFSPFFSTKSKGAGLGLAMTKKIVEEIGGKVRLTSQLGVGTTIYLYLQPLLAASGRAVHYVRNEDGSELTIKNK